MSTIYIQKTNIQFNNFGDKTGMTNEFRTTGSFTFPSNVIGCALSLVGNQFVQQYNSSIGNVIGDISFLGSGVDNVTYNGTQVIFTAWMRFLAYDGSNTAYLDSNQSYLMIQAVAECE